MPTIDQLNISRKSSVMADELAYITNQIPEELRSQAMRIVVDLNLLSSRLADTDYVPSGGELLELD